jgi:hypothetical protein
VFATAAFFLCCFFQIVKSSVEPVLAESKMTSCDDQNRMGSSTTLPTFKTRKATHLAVQAKELDSRQGVIGRIARI